MHVESSNESATGPKNMANTKDAQRSESSPSRPESLQLNQSRQEVGRVSSPTDSLSDVQGVLLDESDVSGKTKKIGKGLNLAYKVS